ncbi:hypothetical protein KSS87_019198 [Heliosperma pusillum]|nr:hypothetical protein KSS87_019198 [Heliosperma pusillum]
MFQSSMLPYGNAIKSLLPDNEVLFGVKDGVLSREEGGGEVDAAHVGGVIQEDSPSDGGVISRSDNGLEKSDRIIHGIVSLEGKSQEEPIEFNKAPAPEVFDNRVKNGFPLASGTGGSIDQIAEKGHQISQNSSLELNGSSNFKEEENVENWNRANLELSENVKDVPLKDFAILEDDTKVMSRRRRNKKPQWSSPRDCDKEIIDAKFKIINAPASLADKDLYAPVFRNVSKFIRSYELMEKTLKVYVYKDGTKPIFHQPILKGLYASEGWFMKLLEGNKHFVVKNPEKAHLFYMPFSSRMLEYTLYVPNSHNRTKLRQFVKGYTETIAAKYPFWNRTGGADHFVAACHDWALYETRHHMENSIKALCNADVTIGFKIGRDVSLPETYIRYARNPLRDLGGKPPSKRNILAFYAGNSHGYLRPTLLNYWKGKDPDMRIYGLLPASVSKKMNYMQHMKSSKYCLCPKGFEVNSPRVVEAIFYECVPVIISDNFVPPLFEILNWEAFSVIVAEKDIPNLKNILLSIPEAKYMEMQLAVMKVQRHFLWHARPVKYDLFHMLLHSIWHSRVFQIQRQ